MPLLGRCALDARPGLELVVADGQRALDIASVLGDFPPSGRDERVPGDGSSRRGRLSSRDRHPGGYRRFPDGRAEPSALRVAPLLGASYALAERVDDGVALLEDAVERNAAMGSAAGESLHRTWLGEAYLLAGRVGDAARLAARALDLSGQRGERGVHAWALRLHGDIAVRTASRGGDDGHDAYRQALALAEELGMRPLQAHCHRGLGERHRQAGNFTEAREHLGTAIAMFREMGMEHWVDSAEAELRAVPE